MSGTILAQAVGRDERTPVQDVRSSLWKDGSRHTIRSLVLPEIGSVRAPAV